MLLSEVAGSTFRLGAICVVFDLNILRLRVHGSGDNFSVPVEPDEHGEVTDACGRFFLPLPGLEQFSLTFFMIPSFLSSVHRVFHYRATCVPPFFA